MRSDDDTRRFVYALRVLEDGRPMGRTTVHEGSDYFFATETKGLRWGRCELVIEPNGSVEMIVWHPHEFPRCWPIYSSSYAFMNTAMGLEIRKRLYARLGLKDWRQDLPGRGDLDSRRERAADINSGRLAAGARL